MISKTGKKATNAAEKARKTHKPDAAQRKIAACHRKLLAKNDRKAKNRAARQVPANTCRTCDCTTDPNTTDPNTGTEESRHVTQ